MTHESAQDILKRLADLPEDFDSVRQELEELRVSGRNLEVLFAEVCGGNVGNLVGCVHTLSALADGSKDAAKALFRLLEMPKKFMPTCTNLAQAGVCGGGLARIFENQCGGNVPRFIRHAEQFAPAPEPVKI